MSTKQRRRSDQIRMAGWGWLVLTLVHTVIFGDEHLTLLGFAFAWATHLTSYVVEAIERKGDA